MAGNFNYAVSTGENVGTWEKRPASGPEMSKKKKKNGVGFF